MSKATCSASYHVLKSDPKLNEPPALLAEDESEADDDEGTNKSPLWKALINLMGDLEGTGTLALPYAISQSGLIAISGLIIIPFIAFYTGAILIDCLYDENDAGERVRVRSNYKQLGDACSSRYSGTIVSAIQLIHLFLVASLYLVLCASLARGIFPDLPLSDSFWMFIAAAVVLPTLFLASRLVEFDKCDRFLYSCGYCFILWDNTSFIVESNYNLSMGYRECTCFAGSYLV